jgi:hypothetical protein
MEVVTMRTEREAMRDALASGAVQRWIDGGEIECRRLPETHWNPHHSDNPNWTTHAWEWRIAPEPPPEPPPVVKWIEGEPPRVKGVKYLQAYCGGVESISWCPYLEQFVDLAGGWNKVEFWAPMCNLPGDVK